MISQRIRAAERKALCENNRIRSRRQNSQHLQDEVCRILSPSAPVVSSSVGSSRVQPVDNNCRLLISPTACEEFAVSVVPLDTGGESTRLGLAEPTPLVVKSSHHDTFPSFWG